MTKRKNDKVTSPTEKESSKRQMTSSNEIKNRGAFILFEGCDRSGKTTQTQLLVKALKDKGHKIEFANFPGNNNKKKKKIYIYIYIYLIYIKMKLYEIE